MDDKLAGDCASRSIHGSASNQRLPRRDQATRTRRADYRWHEVFGIDGRDRKIPANAEIFSATVVIDNESPDKDRRDRLFLEAYRMSATSSVDTRSLGRAAR